MVKYSHSVIHIQKYIILYNIAIYIPDFLVFTESL